MPPNNTRELLKSIIGFVAPIGSKRFTIAQYFIEFLRPLRLLNRQYQKWIALFDPIHIGTKIEYQIQIGLLKYTPTISIIMPVYNPNQMFFQEAVDSVFDQMYPNWELCIADDGSSDPKVREMIKNFSNNEPRVKYIFREQNGHISAASNSALSLATGDFIALLDHDDLLHPLALYYCAKVINDNPDCEIIYSDEDKITRFGKRVDPYFKSDFDYDLFLNHNMVIHLGVIKHKTVRDVGGFRVGFEGSQDYDLILRMIDIVEHKTIKHIPHVLYHWRMSISSSAGNINIKPYASTAGVKAISEHLERKKVEAVVEYQHDYAIYQTTYLLPVVLPSVEIVIYLETLTPESVHCVDELITHTSYEKFHITLGLRDDHKGFSEPDKWLQNPRISIKRGIQTSQRSIALNQLIKSSFADFICLIDPNLRGFTTGWLNKMVGQAIQNGVGAVGCKLVFTDGKVFSNGIILGDKYQAVHLFQNTFKDDPGYLYWAMLQKGYSALSSTCMLIQKSIYQEIGGFDEQFCQRLFSDVDFCLKLRELNLRNILIPSIILEVVKPEYFNIPADDLVQSKIKLEREIFNTRWQNWFSHDPSFSPNLVQSEKGEIRLNFSPNDVLDRPD